MASILPRLSENIRYSTIANTSEVITGKHNKKCIRSGHSISTCPEKNYTKPLEKPNFQKQTFNQARKGNQNLPNRRVTSNIMTGKPLPFSHHSCSNSREQRSRSRHRSPN